jgi:hypothetical protein
MVMGALFLAAAVVFATLLLDLGVFLARVNKAQWEAEGMAKAAAQQLSRNSDQADALRVGKDWLYANNVDRSQADCCTFGDLRPLEKPDGLVDTVTATAQASEETYFLHYLGLPKVVSVRRTATAQVVGAQGGAVCPWGIIADTSGAAADGKGNFGLTPGRIYEFDLAATPQRPGDFVALDLARSGVGGYQQAIAAGCRKQETGVWSVGDVTSFLQNGAEVSTATLDALTVHYDFESADGVADYMGLEWCDVAFQRDEDGPGIGHAIGFNPYVQIPRRECVRGSLDGGAGRLVVVPIVSPPPANDPLGAVRILGLASMYVVSWDRTGSPASGHLYGMFFDRANTDAVDLVGEDDNPLAPLHVELLK